MNIEADDLIKDFNIESKNLVEELESLLEDIEEDFSKKEKLNNFAQIVDRIMGSAQSLSAMYEGQTEIKKLGDFAELCKQIGYRGANLKDEEFYTVTISFLWDSIETMKKLLIAISENTKYNDALASTFLSRLKWIIQQFNEHYVEATQYTVTSTNMKSQEEVDALLNSFSL